MLRPFRQSRDRKLLALIRADSRPARAQGKQRISAPKTGAIRIEASFPNLGRCFPNDIFRKQHFLKTTGKMESVDNPGY